MLYKYLRRIPIIALLFGFHALSHAQVLVTGNIETDTIWNADGNPYVITTDPSAINPLEIINIISGVTLTINPGVVIEVDGPVEIAVQGTLAARGTANNPIIVRPRQTGGQWRSITFDPGAVSATFDGNGNYQNGSILEYIQLTYGGSPTLYKSAQSPSIPALGVVNIDSARPYLNHVTVSNGDATGIYAIDIDGLLKIENCTIADSYDSSIDKRGGAMYLAGLTAGAPNFQVRHNTITGNTAQGNGGGIAVVNANVLIQDNVISNNITLTGAGGGISVSGNSDVQIDGNAITLNHADLEGGGIYVNSTTAATVASITISNNAIAGNDTATHGGGIYVIKDVINITGNIIADNTAQGGTISAMEIHSGGTVSQNSVLRNQSDSILATAEPYDSGTGPTALSLTNNNISNNDSLSNVIVNTADTVPTIGSSNIFNNGLGFFITNDDFVNTTLPATNNYFAVPDASLAANMSGLVDSSSAAQTIFTDPVPLTPPGNFTINRNGGSVTMTWSAPPEPDVAGYIVYWGNNQAPLYENAVDVGNALTYAIPFQDSSQNTYFAVTAYDNSYVSTTDDPATYAIESQSAGNESWFSEERMIAGKAPSSGGGGGGLGWPVLLFILVFRLVARIQRRGAVETPYPR